MESERRELHNIAPLSNRSTFEKINLHKRFWLKSGVTVKFYWDSEREDAKPKAQKSVSRGGKRRTHLPWPTQSGRRDCRRA